MTRQFGSFNGKRPHSQRRVAIRLQLEMLEDRVVPSTLDLQFVNNMGVDMTKYTLWVFGTSGPNTQTANGKTTLVTQATALQPNGQFEYLSNGSSGNIPVFSFDPNLTIQLDSSTAVIGSRVYFVLEPKGAPAPVVTYSTSADGITENLTQPAYIGVPPQAGQPTNFFIEVTQPLNGAPTLDLSQVDEFAVPLTMTFSDGTQFGQPTNDSAVNLQSIVSGFQTFLSHQSLVAQTAYSPLVLPFNGTAGQRAGLEAPLDYVGSNPNSDLASYWNPTLTTLFTDTSRTLTLIGDDGVTYQGQAKQLSNGDWVLDFVGGGNEFYVQSPLNNDEESVMSPGYAVLGAVGVFNQRTTYNVQTNPTGSVVTDNTGTAAIGATSVERQIDQALLRGVALEDPAPGSPENTGQWWGDESHWYPAGSTMDLYSEFMHTWTINGTLISLPPIGGGATDAQGMLMGQAYGFSQDESPTNPAQGTTNQPNVPSKYESIPSTVTTDTITFDPWFNTPLPPPPPPWSTSPSASSSLIGTGWTPTLLFLAEDRFSFEVDSLASMFSNNPLFTQAADRAMSVYNTLLDLYNPALFTGLSGLQSAIYANPYNGTVWDMVGQAAGFDWADHSKNWGPWTQSLSPVVALHWAANQFAPAQSVLMST